MKLRTLLDRPLTHREADVNILTPAIIPFFIDKGLDAQSAVFSANVAAILLVDALNDEGETVMENGSITVTGLDYKFIKSYSNGEKLYGKIFYKEDVNGEFEINGFISSGDGNGYQVDSFAVEIDNKVYSCGVTFVFVNDEGELESFVGTVYEDNSRNT